MCRELVKASRESSFFSFVDLSRHDTDRKAEGNEEMASDPVPSTTISLPVVRR